MTDLSRKSSNKLVLTGGGTAGHVIPHLALKDAFDDEGWELHYIGSGGIEKDLISETSIPFYVIKTGKLRRYFSWQNLFDIFRLALGIGQSFILLIRIKPFAVFSKGGFVSVPVCLAAWVLGIPVVSHESDFSPGLANRIIGRFAHQLLYAFAESSKFLPAHKSKFVGTPVRSNLSSGDKVRGLNYAGFEQDDRRTVILVMGGSTGSEKLNRAAIDSFSTLKSKFRMIHLTGKGKSSDFHSDGYASFEYVNDELKDLLACSDIVVGRAGANSIFEWLSLTKPMLLVPLVQGSRGDQVDNARCFQQHGWASVLDEANLSAESLAHSLEELISRSEQMTERQKSAEVGDKAAQDIVHVFRQLADSRGIKV